MSGRSEFEASLSSLSTEPCSETFTRAEISNKITLLLRPKPSILRKKELSRWQMVKDRFELVSYEGRNFLYLTGKNNGIAKRVLSIEELFDTLHSLHRLEGNHTGRTKLYKHASLKHHGVTEKSCGLFVKTCQVCQEKKANKSLKSIVVKPITSTDFLSRAQIDLIDMSDQNLEANVSVDGVTPYKFLLVSV